MQVVVDDRKVYALAVRLVSLSNDGGGRGRQGGEREVGS